MSKAKTNNMYILTWNIVYNNNHVTQKDVQMYFRDLDPEIFKSVVQICMYPDMGMVQEGQAIQKEQWSKWDAESIAQMDVQE